jgi:hypothetical protein
MASPKAADAETRAIDWTRAGLAAPLSFSVRPYCRWYHEYAYRDYGLMQGIMRTIQLKDAKTDFKTDLAPDDSVFPFEG